MRFTITRPASVAFLFSLLLLSFPGHGISDSHSNPHSLYALGQHHYKQQNYSEAEKWYIKAAKMRHYDAAIQLVKMYEKDKKYVKAMAWAKVAAWNTWKDTEKNKAENLRRNIAIRSDVTIQNLEQADALYFDILYGD